jgi:hypothetical protein
MTIFTIDDLNYRPSDRGPWRLYVFDRNGYHRGGKYFQRGALPQYPPNELRDYWITAAFAKDDVIQAMRQGLEVRITDGGDFLVFHWKGGKQIYPADPQTFWDQAGAR